MSEILITEAFKSGGLFAILVVVLFGFYKLVTHLLTIWETSLKEMNLNTKDLIDQFSRQLETDKMWHETHSNGLNTTISWQEKHSDKLDKIISLIQGKGWL